jgi:hypothetical protein
MANGSYLAEFQASQNSFQAKTERFVNWFAGIGDTRLSPNIELTDIRHLGRGRGVSMSTLQPGSCIPRVLTLNDSEVPVSNWIRRLTVPCQLQRQTSASMRSFSSYLMNTWSQRKHLLWQRKLLNCCRIWTNGWCVPAATCAPAPSPTVWHELKSCCRNWSLCCSTRAFKDLPRNGRLI